MSHRGLRSLAVVVILTAGLVANPPPGSLLGIELGTAIWAGLVALATLAGVFTVLRAGHPAAYPAWALLGLPLLGPVHDVFSLGFFAAAAGALAAVLHLELLTFEDRRDRWASLVEDDEALARYERKHRANWVRLALVLAVCLAGLFGAYALLLQIAPPAFADSIEARQVEGMAGVLVVLALLALGIAGLRRDETEEGSR